MATHTPFSADILNAQLRENKGWEEKFPKTNADLGRS